MLKTKCAAALLCTVLPGVSVTGSGASQTPMFNNMFLYNYAGLNIQNVSGPDSCRSILSSNILSEGYAEKFDINSDGTVDILDLINLEQRAKRYDSEITILQENATAVSVTEQPAVTEPPVVTAPPTATTDISVEQTAPVTESAPPEIDDTDMISYGIDVSRYQGRIDWQKVKDSGVQFAMIKAGEGTSVADRFYENIQNAQAAGIECGVYWFSQARSTDDAIAEANACIDTISGYKLSYPVACDYEYRALKNNNPLASDKAKMTDAIVGFLSYIQNSGYYAMLYTNTDFSRTYLEFDRINADYDIWFAGYKVSEPTMKCGIWQYSETGRLDGLDMDGLNCGNTYVDLDISYRNYPAKMKKYHLNGF